MMQRLLWPLTRLGETFDLYQRAMVSTTRVLNLLETKISIEEGALPLDTSNVNMNSFNLNRIKPIGLTNKEPKKYFNYT